MSVGIRIRLKTMMFIQLNRSNMCSYRFRKPGTRPRNPGIKCDRVFLGGKKRQTP